VIYNMKKCIKMTWEISASLKETRDSVFDLGMALLNRVSTTCDPRFLPFNSSLYKVKFSCTSVSCCKKSIIVTNNSTVILYKFSPMVI
jgi:hypothetical protein